MSWDFETEPEFQKELDWIEKFVREEVEPLEFVLDCHPYDVRDPKRNALVRPLQAEVKKRKLWACHLGPELGGQGYGQVKLALLNEILGRSNFGPTVFGCHAPDSGLAEKQQVHAYLRFTGVRVPLDHMLGEPGQAFVVAQTRLGGGRLHHAMRTIGQARRMLDHLCERAVSRETQGEKLSQKQMIQEKIADSWIELEQFRLLVLRTAWLCDKHKDYNKVRKDISAVKVAMPKVLNDIASRALQIHGSIGVSTEMPFMNQIAVSFIMGL